MGMVAAFATAGLLAVAVTGVMNSFSDGETLTAGKLNTNFNSLKAAIEAVNTRLVAIESLPAQPTMRLIYETDVTSATTSVNVTGLNGDVDLEYQIKCRFITGAAAPYILVQPNGDSTAGNYISRGVWTTNNATTNGDVNNYGGILIGYGTTANQTSQSFSYFYAKTGLIRHLNNTITLNGDASNLAAGTYSGTWLNSASNITSIKITSSVASGIGAGSHIEVWARR